MEYLLTTQSPIVGASDASFIIPDCSHAWIISSSNPDHYSDQDMLIIGTGMVDGSPSSINPFREELQGQTAFLIILHLFLSHHQQLSHPIKLITDCESAIKKENLSMQTVYEIINFQTLIYC